MNRHQRQKGMRVALNDIIRLTRTFLFSSLTSIMLIHPWARAEETPETSKSSIDPLMLVAPEFRGPLRAIPKLKIAEDVSPQQLGVLRKLQLPRPRLAEPTVSEKMIPGRNGSPEVKVFVINARPGESLPAILHMHGGGYIIGSAANDVPDLQVMAKGLGCVIVTVEYRLAPETPFPGSLDDNYAALKWLYTEAKTLGVDSSRIAVAGESAGGGHAAMLAIAARDRREVPVIYQSLVYPMLDDRTGSSRQVPAYIGTYVWTAEYNRSGWKALLGHAPGQEKAPNGAVPSRLADFKGLAPAWIGTGSIDLFVDEDIEYARRMIDAGVPTELIVVPGAYHGFDRIVPTSSLSKQFTLSRYNGLARAFGNKELSELPE